MRQPKGAPVLRRMSDILAQQAADGIIGRGRELRALLDILAADAPRVVHLSGIPGIGKSTLLTAFAARAQAEGAWVVRIDARTTEPTPRGFLRALPDSPRSVAEAAERLVAEDRPVVLLVDAYEGLRLLDAWLRQTFLPALDIGVRVVLAARAPPSPSWTTDLAWQGLFRSLNIGPLDDDASLELLRTAGLGTENAHRVLRFAHGHPLALKLAAQAVLETPSLDLRDSGLHRVLADLARLFLSALDDPALRAALEAASVVRRVTVPLLAALVPGEDPQRLYEDLRGLSFVDAAGDGLFLHEAVRDPLAAALAARDPVRHRALRQAAWQCLSADMRAAGPAELWRYTADVIYLIGNNAVHEAFFPRTTLPYAVEPATDADGRAIMALAAHHDGGEAAGALAKWWSCLPEAFHVARDTWGSVVGFYCMATASSLERRGPPDDPVAAAWRHHLRDDPPPHGQEVLFLRRWLSQEEGETPGPVQAACWLDIKRTYMELRPALRRVYLTLRDPLPYASAARQLGMRPLPQAECDLGGAWHTALLDFGPGSVDGWLSGLLAAELGVPEAGVLDTGTRELVLPEGRIRLTPREFQVMRYFCAHSNKVVSRGELLDEVWGLRYDGASNVIDVVVAALRRKLGPQANTLETVHGVGYIFHA